MKNLTRRSFTAAGILAAIGITIPPMFGLKGCSVEFDPSYNMVECVYGPPPEDVNDPEDFEPTQNVNVDVYGPPDDMPEPFDPYENTNVCVYGPPEWFE